MAGQTHKIDELADHLGQLIDGLVRYKEHRIPTGHFLQAVLENNLQSAVARADNYSRLHLLYLVDWCRDNLPTSAWGSPKRVKEWLGGHETPGGRDA